MPEQIHGTSTGSGQVSSTTPPLPNLNHVDLHVLLTTEDPAITAAADHALRRPEQFTEIWWGDSPEGGHRGAMRWTTVTSALDAIRPTFLRQEGDCASRDHCV
ncbi:hypothetical protein [Streptomyces sp. MUM 178J]|uniref:hypothetical protein n=1 Tax=Streptomyces sp. MUM 178J TaxID=2791991 RepID=UPI001F03DFFF|nr:hypothetical protein [Streptomyces sp. MUM 178J]WRQ81132.1 hypothetical protein I3F59_018255 [Streptomyces sp. MUM 178J]